MRALVRRGNAVALEERPIPRPGPNDVVVRATAASMCSADVASISGEFPADDGTVIGHEGVGVVHEVGDLIEGFHPGERVTTIANTPCGRCANCQRGIGGHCGGVAWGGYSSGLTRDGVMAEYFTVPDAGFNLARIPDEVTDAHAVCVCDSMASGMTGPELAGVPLGGTVAVFGLGHIGLCATAGARALGAGVVIGIRARAADDTVPRRMGADHVISLADGDPTDEILRLTGGEGVDLAIEASGVRDSFPNAVKLTRIGGTICVLSSYAGDPDAALQLPLKDWGWGIGDKAIVSLHVKPGAERLTRLLRLLASGRVDLTPLITHKYSLDDAGQAFQDLSDRRDGIIKPLITF